MSAGDNAISRSLPATAPASESRGGRLPLVLALLSVYLIWGSTYLGIRLALDVFPPFLMAAIRFMVAGTTLFVFLRLRGHPMPTRRQWLGAAVVGIFLLVGGNGSVTFSEQWVASGIVSLVVATSPLWASLFEGLWGTWPSKLEWVGLALGFGGVLMLSTESGLQANLLGTIAVFAAPILWSFGSIWSKHLQMPTGMMSSAAEMLVGGVVFLAISFGLGEKMTKAPTLVASGALLYLIVFGSIVAFSAYLYLLQRVRPSVAISYAYVNPVVAVALGVGFVGESITWLGVAGMLVILTAVAVLSLVRSGTANDES